MWDVANLKQEVVKLLLDTTERWYATKHIETRVAEACEKKEVIKLNLF